MKNLLVVTLSLFSTTAYAGNLKPLPAHTITQTLICTDPSIIGRVKELVDANDPLALAKYLKIAAASGNCGLLEKNTPVMIENLDTDNLAVCVRQRGEPACAWTSPVFLSTDR
jgi:hypothetical protein